MYDYFGLKDFQYDYVQSFDQLFDRTTNLPIQQGADWELSCFENTTIPVHTLVFEKSFQDFTNTKNLIDDKLKNTPIETTTLLIQFLYTRIPPQKSACPALLALCNEMQVQPALCSLLE